MLKQRLLTALVLIPLILALLWYLPATPFLWVTTFIIVVAAWEWSSLMQLQNRISRGCYVGLVLVALYAALFLPTLIVFLASLLWWLVALVLLLLYARGICFWNRGPWLRGIMGILVLIPCWMALKAMRMDAYGLYALVYLLLLIWGADSAAYFVGRQWGTLKFAPRISPNKSVQGVIAALVMAGCLALLGAYFMAIPYALWGWGLLLSVLTVIFSIMGDLFESMLKREAGVKDSGHLLPGHGGFLDRIDSLTAAAPIYVVANMLLALYFS